MQARVRDVTAIDPVANITKTTNTQIKYTVRHHATLDIRLRVLQILTHSPCRTSNAYVLKAALQEFGHYLSQDRVETEISWLDEQGLVEVEHNQVTVVELTQIGADIANNTAKCPGVSTSDFGGRER